MDGGLVAAYIPRGWVLVWFRGRRHGDEAVTSVWLFPPPLLEEELIIGAGVLLLDVSEENSSLLDGIGAGVEEDTSSGEEETFFWLEHAAISMVAVRIARKQNFFF